MNSMPLENLRHPPRKPDFTTVTELPGGRATREQLSMLYTRYHFASSFCGGKKVLEVGCGAGQGIGYLARDALKVVGVDIDERNLKIAQNHYDFREKIEFEPMDAHALAFDDETFDVIVFFEAIYYLKHPHAFLAECWRVLRDKGTLLVGTVNPEWQDFHPSPFSTRYFNAQELHDLMQSYGFNTTLYAGFQAEESSLKSKMISQLKRAARRLGLMPRTMQGKEFLKRVFFGELRTIPFQVEEAMADYVEPKSILPVPGIRQFKILYAVGEKRGRIQ